MAAEMPMATEPKAAALPKAEAAPEEVVEDSAVETDVVLAAASEAEED